MKTILLTQGKVAIISDEDFESLSKFSCGYAQISEHVNLGVDKYKSKTIYIYTQIMGLADEEVNHINGNTLDNRRENLRLVNHMINIRNRKSVPGSTSEFVGVHLHKLTNKWHAQIKVNGKRKSLELFNTPEEARTARVKFIESQNLEGFWR